MEQPVLDQEELDAIRQKVAPKPTNPLSVVAPEPTPIPLIDDERDGASAKPAALKVFNAWLPRFSRLLGRSLTTTIELGVADVCTVDAPTLRDEVGATWSTYLQDDDVVLLVSIGGPIIEYVAARLLGSKDKTSSSKKRLPSSVGRSLFARVGGLALASLKSFWRDELTMQLTTAEPEAVRRKFWKSDVILTATAEITAPASGKIMVAGSPRAFLPKGTIDMPFVEKTRPSNAALENVPVEVSVELGHAALTMREVAALAPGTFIELSSTVETPLPIRCAGIVKAHGRPVLSNGTVAVEIVSLLGGRNVD